MLKSIETCLNSLELNVKLNSKFKSMEKRKEDSKRILTKQYKFSRKLPFSKGVTTYNYLATQIIRENLHGSREDARVYSNTSGRMHVFQPKGNL